MTPNTTAGADGFAAAQQRRSAAISLTAWVPTVTFSIDVMTFVSAVGTVATIVSLGLYLRERSRRTEQTSYVLGLLNGLRTHAAGMANAGANLRKRAEEERPSSFHQYAEDSVSGWWSLVNTIDKELLKMGAAVWKTAPSAPTSLDEYLDGKMRIKPAASNSGSAGRYRT